MEVIKTKKEKEKEKHRKHNHFPMGKTGYDPRFAKLNDISANKKKR